MMFIILRNIGYLRNYMVAYLFLTTIHFKQPHQILLQTAHCNKSVRVLNTCADENEMQRTAQIERDI